MRHPKLHVQLPALFLALAVSFPQPVLALRPEGPGDSRPLQQKLRAGMEERAQSTRESESPDEIRRRLNNALNDLREVANQELGRAIQWPSGTRDPRNRLNFLLRTFLLHPKPESVRVPVRALMGKINSDILPDLRRIDDWVEILPTADDWLGFQLSPVVGDKEFTQMSRSVAIYSEEGSAKIFGRQGAHLRSDFVGGDYADIETAQILMRGFFPQLVILLDRVEQGHREDEPQARRYAAALFNGLMIPSKNWTYSLSEYKGYFSTWMRSLELRGSGIVRPEAILGRAARAFPDLFPRDPEQIPLFLEFHNEQFLYLEMELIAEYNRGQPDSKKVTLWGLVTGDDAAQPYMRLHNKSAKDGAKRELLRQVYAYLLEEGERGLAAAGVEEKAGSELKDTRFRTLDLSQFFKETWIPGGDLMRYYKSYFRLHGRVVQNPDKPSLFLVLWREPVVKGPEQRMVRHLPFLEYAIYEVAAALGVNATEILIPTKAERDALVRKYSIEERIQPEDISLRRLVSSYTVEEAKAEGFELDPKKAFTRALLFLGLLARVWDLHEGNVEKIPGTEIPVFFDFEQALNTHYDDIEIFVQAFLLNYFQPNFNPGPMELIHLRDRIDWKEWGAGIRKIEQMDLPALRDQLKSSIAASGYGPAKLVQIYEQMDGYFVLLISHQKRIRSDAKAFWRAVHTQLDRPLRLEIQIDPKASSFAGTIVGKPHLEEDIAKLVAAAEAEIRVNSLPDAPDLRKRAVIVDGTWLHLPEMVLLIRALERSELFRGRTILWGEEELVKAEKPLLPKGLLHARDQEELEKILSDLSDNGLETVTFIGRGGLWGREVSAAVEAVILKTKREISLIRPEKPSLILFLQGFGVSSDLAAEMAAGMEEAELLGAGA